MNKAFLLLRTLLLSTSQRNILKHTEDKKKRRKIIGGFIGSAFVYLIVMVYSVFMCIGYGQYGIIDAAPVMCALVICMLSFIFTLFRTNGYLFNFKEYDMLMSLPLDVRTVAACKFLYMYVKTLPWYLSISVAMLIGYGFFASPSFYVYPLWLILSLILPILPMLVSAFIGFIIARVSAGFRKNNILQTVLLFIFVIFCFSLRFIIEDMFRDDKVEQTVKAISEAADTAARYCPPAKWFAGSVTGSSPLSALLLVGVSAALFAVVFLIVGNSYRNINSALKSHAAAKKYRMKKQKSRSLINAVAFKEFKRLTGSSNYMVNAAIGEILAALFGIVTLFVGFDTIVEKVTNGAPLDGAVLSPAIPFIVYFFIGMMATTVCSPSLEGKSYWIVQSLPIEKKTLYNGKMLFNMYLTVPFMAFSTLCLCISAKVSPLNTALYLILGFALCAFSTARGCVCGVKHLRLDWENEIEVIKQSSGVTIYILPNMFVTMGLCVLVCFLGKRLNHSLIAGVFILLTAGLALLEYRRALKLAENS